MLKLKKLFTNGFYLLKGIFLFLILSTILFLIEVAGEESVNKLYKIHDEIKISLKEMDCDYGLEEYYQDYFNFDYPKLIITKNEAPIIVFIDETSKKLIFAEYADPYFTITNSIPPFKAEDSSERLFDEWPIIFSKKGKIYFASLIETNTNKKKQFKINLFDLDRQNNRFNLQKEISLNNAEVLNELPKSCSLSGIYPYGDENDKFLIVGIYNSIHFYPIAWVEGGFITFLKNFSLFLEDNEIGKYQRIESTGWFGTKRRAYTVSNSQIVHSGWIRDTSHAGISNKHNETVCYSQYINGIEWSKPIELYSVKKTHILDQITYLSITSYAKSAFLLWQDNEKGIYFTEINDGIQQEVTQIAEIKHSYPEGLRYNEPLWMGSNIKITVDHRGNIYVLWIRNYGLEYEMYLKTRIDGKWTNTLLINSNRGDAKLPDMKVDKYGAIHITYIKRLPKEKFGCYYMKLSPKE